MAKVVKSSREIFDVDSEIKKFIDGKTIRKVIYVPKKLLNIVAN